MDTTVFNKNNCVICLGEFSSCTEKVTVVKTGIPNLIKYNAQWGGISLQVYFETQSKKDPLGKVLVHASCNCEYDDPKQTKRPLSNSFCCLFVFFASFIISSSNYSTT